MISRRRLLAAAATVAGFTTPARPQAELADGGLQVLRARPASAPQSFGFDGVIPGPTLRIKRGEELRVRLINELSEPTAIHWHGVRVPNAMDGVPELTQPHVQPGASFDYRFRPPDAGTYWYHAPAPSQIGGGLFGALIVEEPQGVAVDHDIPMVFGMPVAAGSSPPSVTVNGSIRPDVAIDAGTRLRLRFINATAARGLVLRVERHMPWLMAVDGQPAEPFVSRDGRAALAPGGRIDLVMDAIHEPGTVTPILAGLDEEQPVARFVYRSGGSPPNGARRDPAPFPPNPLSARIDLRNALRVEMDVGVAKLLNPAGPPLFRAPRGRPVALALRNPARAPRVVHVHGHSFRHLDRLDDGWKPYWLDSIVVGAETERIAFAAENPGRWLIAGRALDRPDVETQAYFAVS